MFNILNKHKSKEPKVDGTPSFNQGFNQNNKNEQPPSSFPFQTEETIGNLAPIPELKPPDFYSIKEENETTNDDNNETTNDDEQEALEVPDFTEEDLKKNIDIREFEERIQEKIKDPIIEEDVQEQPQEDMPELFKEDSSDKDLFNNDTIQENQNDVVKDDAQDLEDDAQDLEDDVAQEKLVQEDFQLEIPQQNTMATDLENQLNSNQDDDFSKDIEEEELPEFSLNQNMQDNSLDIPSFQVMVKQEVFISKQNYKELILSIMNSKDDTKNLQKINELHKIESNLKKHDEDLLNLIQELKEKIITIDKKIFT